MNPTKLHFPHPGEILRQEFLDEMGISQYRLGIDTGMPHSRITALVQGRRSVTADTALRLARYFGNSPDFWLGLQQEFDLRQAREKFGRTIEQEVRPLSVG